MGYEKTPQGRFVYGIERFLVSIYKIIIIWIGEAIFKPKPPASEFVAENRSAN